jgi:quercetin dioxygenase-like cupin family protein
MYFLDPSERETRELAPGARIRAFSGDNMTLSLVELDPNSLVPNHTHPHEQGGIVIDGELEMSIGGASKILKPGDIYIIPGEVEHWAKTKTSSAKVLDIFSPVREEFKY